MSRIACFIAVAIVLCGFRAWGDDYSYSSRVIADAKADQERAITAAIELSSQQALTRDRQTHEGLLQLREVIRLQREDNAALHRAVETLTRELQRRGAE